MPSGPFFTSVLRAFRVRSEATGVENYNETPDLGGNAAPNGDLACDRSGNLWVRTALEPGTAPLTFSSAVSAATGEVHAGAMTLTQFGGFNPSAAQIYVQLFDKTAALVLGDVPFMVFQVPAAGSFAWKPTLGGRAIANALRWGVSSTSDTYTALATNIWVFAEGTI